VLEKSFSNVYTKFKLNFYKKIFSRFETREASLTAVETFCVEVIGSVPSLTINEFAKFVNISQANATYKVQSLIEKGYVTKTRSEKDKREYLLTVTEKFDRFCGISKEYVHTVVGRMKERFTEEEIQIFHRMLDTIDTELMPEVQI